MAVTEEAEGIAATGGGDAITYSSDSETEGYFGEGPPLKRPKTEEEEPLNVLPLGFLDPLPPLERIAMTPSAVVAAVENGKGNRQFWKAGDYDGAHGGGNSGTLTVGMDHVRVHPKFLHSNATSHKWALGAFAELLDNSLDEVCHGATFAKVDVLDNMKDGSKMLSIEDDGGGMDPDKMRQCMSLGYSAKSKSENTIGQYGNGFKTSTMRLGADVIVFSRCCGREGSRPTQSIGMLSYSFLKNTRKEDIIVPMIDYEKRQSWTKMARTSSDLWHKNVETIVQWSPFFSESDLLQQFVPMTDHGTRIVIYNLWEDDQGDLELDFCADKYDIQVRGVNRDEKKIQMAEEYLNSRHFLTYRHSLRSYASILYLRLPPPFRIILRGKEIEHHNIVTDMMHQEEIIYRPVTGADGLPKDSNMFAILTIGFVKDAKSHIDIQGFNVYHKNRLIKPFWRVWNAAGSDGRGVIGVLEANFVEPAHDKQGFERTTVLARLEARLIHLQKKYWAKNCEKIGYAPRCKKRLIKDSADKESSTEAASQPSKFSRKDASPSIVLPRLDKSQNSDRLHRTRNVHVSDIGETGRKKASTEKNLGSQQPKPHERHHTNNERDSNTECISTEKHLNEPNHRKANNSTGENHAVNGRVGTDRNYSRSHSKAASDDCSVHESNLEDSDSSIKLLAAENRKLKDRIKKMEDSMSQELQYERDKNKSLALQLEEAKKKYEALDGEQEALISLFSEERCRRDAEEANLRKKLMDSSAKILELLEKLNSTRRVTVKREQQR